jgi:hypothetical protein
MKSVSDMKRVRASKKGPKTRLWRFRWKGRHNRDGVGVKLSTMEARVLRERRGKTLCGRCRGSQMVGVMMLWELNAGSDDVTSQVWME